MSNLLRVHGLLCDVVQVRAEKLGALDVVALVKLLVEFVEEVLLPVCGGRHGFCLGLGYFGIIGCSGCSGCSGGGGCGTCSVDIFWN